MKKIILYILSLLFWLGCEEEKNGLIINYCGIYDISPNVQYSCAFDVVSINLSEIFVVHEDSTIVFVQSNNSANISGSTYEMMGTINENSSQFNASVTIPGGCKETYLIQGNFTSDTTFEASFNALYEGNCFDCSDKVFLIEGVR